MLEIRNLTAGYDAYPIVDRVWLSMKEGQITGIVGESGCGKSTLLKAIDLLPGSGVRIREGEILFDGKDLTKLGNRQLSRLRGKEICMIFQKPEASFDPVIRIRDQFYEAIRIHDRTAGRSQADALSAGILQKLHFEEPGRILDAYPFELSGGMNQRVAIAMAMVNRPRLILADEPTSALDVTVQSQVVRLLRETRDSFGTSVLIVSHNMNVMTSLADNLGVMYGGQMVEFGSMEDVSRRPAHPYTVALLKAVPAIDGTLPEGIPGRPPSFETRREGCAFADRCPYVSEACRREMPEKVWVSETHWMRCLHKANRMDAEG